MGAEEGRISRFVNKIKSSIIHLIISLSLASGIKKLDNYLDNKFGPDHYDKKISFIIHSVVSIIVGG